MEVERWGLFCFVKSSRFPFSFLDVEPRVGFFTRVSRNGVVLLLEGLACPAGVNASSWFPPKFPPG